MELQNISLPRDPAFVQKLYSNPIKDILHGDKAFYNQPNYVKATQSEFSQQELLPVSYTNNTEHKIISIAKEILSVIIFPIGIYKFLHILAAKVILLPASNPNGYPVNYANESRSNVILDGEWKYKRLTIEVNGYKIDAAIIGKPSTLNNGRWILDSNGNGEFYEDKLSRCEDFKEILSELNSNAIVFNYPGVGSSSGPPNRRAMEKAYRAMLSFLEDQEKGIGAKEIIAYGHSIGGGIQGDALKKHKSKKGIKYVFVKSRTFSNMYTTASDLTNKYLALLVKLLGWNINPVKSSKNLQAPEIIMQTASVDDYEELDDSAKIIGDDIISANS